MRRTLVPILALALLLTPLAALAGETADKPAAIRQLMQVMGVDSLSVQFSQTMAQQVFQGLKVTRPDLPADAQAIVQEEIARLLAEGGDQLQGQIVAIYDRTFSEAEIRELTAFYQTELGRKTVAVTPQILQQSLEAGKAWGQANGPKLMARLEARFKQSKEKGATK